MKKSEFENSVMESNKKKRRHQQLGVSNWIASFFAMVLLFMVGACSQSISEEAAINTLTQEEQEAGWELLFDGQDPSAQWTGKGSETFPTEGWIVEDGVFKVLSGRKGGDIITREQFSDFEFVLEFRLTDSANTGIKYFVSPLEGENGSTSLNGPEYQIIDDFKHESVKDGISPETSTASLYLLYEPEGKVLHEIGEWNQAKIVAQGTHVEHWLNGTKVLEYERGSPDFQARVTNTKFNEYRTSYGESEFGHILLQDHNDEAHFRNIKIRRLR